MSGGLRNSVDSVKQHKVTPNFFSFYAHEIADLLSSNDDTLSNSGASELSQRKYRMINGTKTRDCNYKDSGSFFENSIDDGLPELKKVRLKALLRQAVSNLSMEVDEMLNPVLNMCQLQHMLKSSSFLTPALDGNVAQGDSKRPKKLSSCKSNNIITTSPTKSGSMKQVEDDFQFLLTNDNQQLVEETMKKYSDELSSTMLHMEQKLEETLDAIMSKCRPMKATEKRQLLKLIKNLPQENLVRVAEIIQHGRPAEKSCGDEIFVDLLLEENATLWRLYYYVEAVEKAKMLAHSQCGKTPAL